MRKRTSRGGSARRTSRRPRRVSIRPNFYFFPEEGGAKRGPRQQLSRREEALLDFIVRTDGLQSLSRTLRALAGITKKRISDTRGSGAVAKQLEDIAAQITY